MADDEKVIEVISKPKKLGNNPYDNKNTDIIIKVLNGFTLYYKKLATIFGLSIENLNDMNCLKELRGQELRNLDLGDGSLLTRQLVILRTLCGF